MPNIGAGELIIILIIVLLIFGSSQLPKLARSIGQASREFKKGVDEGASDDDAGQQETNQQDKSQEHKQQEKQ